MPSYKSNVQSILGGIINRLENVDKVVISKIVRTVATDLVESNIRRIHNEGKNVDGSNIGTYSASYKKLRQRKDKETAYVNLSFSGKLSKEFNLDAIDDRTIGIGFTTQYSAKLYDILEDKYGKKIWGVTQVDEKTATDIEKDILNKALV